jgi:hypothetical protein
MDELGGECSGAIVFLDDRQDAILDERTDRVANEDLFL